MKTIFLKMSGLLAGLALLITTTNVNSACIITLHQPKMPEAAKKLRKF